MSKLRLLLSNKFFAAFLALVLVLMVGAEYKQYRQRSAVQKEIESLQQQASQIEQKNQDLQALISNLGSEQYKEQAAREQLGLKKDGEIVYSFGQSQPAVREQGGSSQNSQADAQTNPQKWWNYFFNN